MEPIFKENPQLDVVYKTSNGKYFYTENYAKNYAQTLEDKKVTKLVRTAATDEDAGDENKENTTSELEAKLEELKTLELVKSNYNQMKSLVKYFDLNTEDQKAETYIKALEEYKQQISQ
ncbi:hypothetical protein ACT4R9_09695 [Ornithobacterium rhinotracheale]|uniref:hypothetical protein n=1 Tax=Ornithobacterium rhinotracheale TaxID=28251 RepID=UPI001FF56623|nr:hypothetical protein [Ornithobacterium rhinotracheale]MCK0206215.1 hypothetical protein [Ornithobacterium rhinotracheale]